VTDWADLDPVDRASLLSSPKLEVTVGCELVNFDLTVADDDLATDLDPSSGTVQWTGAATVHRGCTVTLSRQLDWGNALIRLYRTYFDGLTGLSARANRGVFVLMAPDRPIGETPQSWQVTGQDRLYLLNRQVGRSYVVPLLDGSSNPTKVLAAVAQVFVDAGLTGVLIDSTRAAAVMPQAMTWPLIPAQSDTAPVVPPPDSGQGDTATSGPSTWQQIVNDLLGLINYRAVWCDENGMFRCDPYLAPESRQSAFTFDADDEFRSTVAENRTESGNYYAPDTPNLYIFQWSNIPDVSDGAGGTTPATPVEGNGLYTRPVSSGPTSAAARNGLVWPTQVQLTAASQTDLVAQAERRVADDLRLVTTLSPLSTVPFPASHYDVLTVTDKALGGSWVVEAQSWTEHLDGGDTEWQFQRVV
jgi:hypothetical protein